MNEEVREQAVKGLTDLLEPWHYVTLSKADLNNIAVELYDEGYRLIPPECGAE